MTLAAAHGQEECVAILLEMQARVSIQNNGTFQPKSTDLHSAKKKNTWSFFSIYVEIEFDLDGQQAIDIAEEKGYSEIVKKLLSFGAQFADEVSEEEPSDPSYDLSSLRSTASTDGLQSPLIAPLKSNTKKSIEKLVNPYVRRPKKEFNLSEFEIVDSKLEPNLFEKICKAFGKSFSEPSIVPPVIKIFKYALFTCLLLLNLELCLWLSHGYSSSSTGIWTRHPSC